MQQKLLRKAGLLSILLTLAGVVLTSCINEPDPTIPPPMTSKVRFVIAVPDAGKMDIWVDSTKIDSLVSYKDVTKYFTLHAGDRFIRMTPTGTDTSNSVFRGIFTIRSLTMNTMSFLGYVNGTVQCWPTQERFEYSDETTALIDSADVKLINLQLDILSASQTVMLYDTYKITNVNDSTHPLKDTTVTRIDQSLYKDAAGNIWWLSNYVRMPIGDRHFSVWVNKGAQVIQPFDYTLETKQRYTFIVIGTNAASDILLLKDDVTVYSH